MKNFFYGLFYLLIGFHAIFLYLYSELLSLFSENFLVQDSISGSFIRFHAYVIITIFDIHEFQLDITTLRSSTGSTWFATITFYSVTWWVIWWDIRVTVWYSNFRNAKQLFKLMPTHLFSVSYRWEQIDSIWKEQATWVLTSLSIWIYWVQEIISMISWGWSGHAHWLIYPY